MHNLLILLRVRTLNAGIVAARSATAGSTSSWRSAFAPPATSAGSFTLRRTRLPCGARHRSRASRFPDWLDRRSSTDMSLRYGETHMRRVRVVLFLPPGFIAGAVAVPKAFHHFTDRRWTVLLTISAGIAYLVVVRYLLRHAGSSSVPARRSRT